MAETTNQKTGGATEVRDMFRNAGLTQRELQGLEAMAGRAIGDNRVLGPKATRWEVDYDLTAFRKGATDAGIDLWRNGPAINPWTPNVDLDGPMPANPCPEPERQTEAGA